MQVAALAGGAAALSVSQGPAHADALSKKAFRNFELVAKRQLTPDTAEYSFRFPDGYAQHRLGLETASYLVARQPPADGACVCVGCMLSFDSPHFPPCYRRWQARYSTLHARL